jgi:hypothetical protein
VGAGRGAPPPGRRPPRSRGRAGSSRRDRARRGRRRAPGAARPPWRVPTGPRAGGSACGVAVVHRRPRREQRPDRVRVAGLAGRRQGGAALVVDRVRLRAGRQQRAHDVGVALGRGDVERSEAAVGLPARVGARPQEEPRDARVAHPAGLEQRERGDLAVALRRGARAEEEAGHLQVARAHRPVQRRLPAPRAADVGPRACRQEGPDDFGAVAGRIHEGGTAAGIRAVDVRAGQEEEPDHLRQPAARGGAQHVHQERAPRLVHRRIDGDAPPERLAERLEVAALEVGDPVVGGPGRTHG